MTFCAEQNLVSAQNNLKMQPENTYSDAAGVALSTLWPPEATGALFGILGMNIVS